ncbi:thiamine phosphate synthase [Phragmitibacter flavus]|uniref:Thiamine-phosphate synthase n=1 Tax=Phragmitibacter flavus TaxID=2576071 RepID=A0A5R8KHW1_9BACT|nr:thiamine phosphate synthase [Phragmitibacter flavus]TLD71913.1 thiamine phosphate synthase [Phragmitibacter flavus]
MKSISECRLYGIVDAGYVRLEDMVMMGRKLVEGGVDVLQLRAKGVELADVERIGGELLKVTRDGGVPLVINDHPSVAASVGSDGVHVGQEDGDLAEVRRVVGGNCFVGRSTHSVAQARAAMEEKADYIGFGPLYATGTKPDYVPIGLGDIAEVEGFAEVPVFCIGGVNLQTLPEVLAAGARRVVIVSALLQAEDVGRAVKQVNEALRQS